MLSRRDIEKELGKGINIIPVIRDNFKENSINLTASKNAWTMGSSTVHCYSGGKFSLRETSDRHTTKTLSKGSNCVLEDKNSHRKFIILLPHSTTLIETTEVLGIASNIGGALHSKVGLVSKGIGHIGTMLGPGYCGHLLIALHNITDEVISLQVGTTCVSLSFDYLTTQVIRTSSTTSGHVDKFADLGVNIDEGTRLFLTQDWKSNIDEIREHMSKTDGYKEYRTHIKNNTWKEFRKYVNKRNIIAVAIILLITIVLYQIAKYTDSKLAEPVWVERFWCVGFSGILATLARTLWDFLKEKNNYGNCNNLYTNRGNTT